MRSRIWDAAIASPKNGGTPPSPPTSRGASVSDWLDDVITPDDDLRTTANGMRGFFLADPGRDCLLLALVDQFASWGRARPVAEFSRLVAATTASSTALAKPLGDRLQVSTDGGSSPCRTAAATSARA